MNMVVKMTGSFTHCGYIFRNPRESDIIKPMNVGMSMNTAGYLHSFFIIL